MKWVKANNPLYADVKIADDWLEEALEEDKELVISMLQLPMEESVNTDNISDKVNEHEQPMDGPDTQGQK